MTDQSETDLRVIELERQLRVSEAAERLAMALLTRRTNRIAELELQLTPQQNDALTAHEQEYAALEEKLASANAEYQEVLIEGRRRLHAEIAAREKVEAELAKVQTERDELAAQSTETNDQLAGRLWQAAFDLSMPLVPRCGGDPLVAAAKEAIHEFARLRDNLGRPSAKLAALPDLYCVTTAGGDCVSTDPRCMHQPTPEPGPMDGWINRYALAIIGKLAAENADDVSDAELDRCLAECVSGRKLILIAQAMRDRGILHSADMAELPYVPWGDIKLRMHMLGLHDFE